MAGGSTTLAPEVGNAAAYLPRVIGRHLLDAQDGVVALDATFVFVDVSGFTRLSEQLAKSGREGAERLADAIGTCFSSLLGVAYANQGSLLKFGGDALLLAFEDEGHLERACASAIGMRRALRGAGRVALGQTRIGLRMSVGVHTGRFDLFLVGASHAELVVAGPAVSRVVELESAAGPGEILVSPEVAARLPARCLGEARGPGRLLVAPSTVRPAPAEPVIEPDPHLLAGCLSTEVRDHVLSGGHAAEHRPVTVGFLKFRGADALIAGQGAEVAAATLGDLVTAVQVATDEHGVCFLGTDVDADGGKFILTAGAPRVRGADEERMLCALRQIIDAEHVLDVRGGVHRGPVFAGDIGPPWRRTFTVMGDAVNLAARLMAAAPSGGLYATREVLDRSSTPFAVDPLPPLRVKGKAAPVEAFAVGASAPRLAVEEASDRVPLIGREAELQILEEALADAAAGRPRLADVTGDPGIGKGYLMRELRARADAARVLRTRCGPGIAASPYAAWHEPLRALLGVPREAPAEDVARALRERVATETPELLPWLPLAAVAWDLELEPTSEVAQLAPGFREARLHDVVTRIVALLLDRLTILEFDDAEFMDQASAGLLRAVASGLEGAPCLLVLVRRPGEGPFADGVGPEALELGLEPLDDAAAMRLARQLTAGRGMLPHALRLAVRRSCGHPQFLRDLLDAAMSGQTSLPDSAEAAATARIDRMAPGDRALVRQAAVLGTEFNAELLAEAIGMDGGLDPETWRRLREVLVQDGDGRAHFRTSVLREAAYAGLPFRSRRQLHQRIAVALERRAGAVAEVAAPLSLHCLLGGDRHGAWKYARLAAQRAWDRYACADAAQLWRRALEASSGLAIPDSDRADAWHALAEACVRLGESDQALAALDRARRLVGGVPAAAAELLERQAAILLDTGRPTAAVRRVMPALRALEAAGGDDAAGIRARLRAVLAGARFRQGRYAESTALCQRTISEAEAAGEDRALAQACAMLDSALFRAGRRGDAGHSYRALDVYRRLGDLERESFVLNNLGTFAYWDGRWDEAVALYEQGMKAAHRAGDDPNAAAGAYNIAEVLSDQGHQDEAAEVLLPAVAVWQSAGEGLREVYGARLQARIDARSGRADAAKAALARALEHVGRLRLPAELAGTEVLLAEAHAFAREPDAAEAICDRLLERAEAQVSAGTLAIIHRVRGCALAQRGRRSDAVEALRSSLAAAELEGSDYDRALTIHALAAVGAASDAQREDRDATFARLHVVAPPSPPAEEATAAHGIGS